MPETPPPPDPIDPELLAELGSLSTEDLCRRLRGHYAVVNHAEARLGEARKLRKQIGRALAERLHREREWLPIEVDGVAYTANRDLRGVHRVVGRLPIGAKAKAEGGGRWWT